MRSDPPTRVIFNFGYRCNMACAWCYVPFGTPRPEPDYCERIVERIAEIGFKVITFGGGDPMMYSFLPDLVATAKKRGLVVHIDTNAIGLACNENSMKLLRSQVDLLGIPLDGADAWTHNMMRSSTTHFDVLMKKLKWLTPIMNKIKINTIVTAANATEIGKMVKLIEQISPARWSIYQYWPLSLGASVRDQHQITDLDFGDATRPLPKYIGSTYIEINPLTVRRLTYPFVSQDGMLYLHDSNNLMAYERLGTIFDEASVLAAIKRCGTEREAATSRYASKDRVSASAPKRD